jgi:hypothetical protein
MEMDKRLKKLSSTLLLLTLLLGACSSNSIAAESFATQTSAPTGTVTETATQPATTETTVPARGALVSEIKDEVSARTSSNEEFAPALIGMNILPGGGVETGIDGRARLDLLPEGTIVRVGPSSSFTIPEITEENGGPKTTIELFFGKIFILLSGGSLDVKTPTGTASVRGSLLSVEYDPEKNIIQASCLEGHCALENESGEAVELKDGETSYIKDGQPPAMPERMDREQIQDWLDEIPELHDFIEALPDPKNFPEPDRRDGLFDPPGNGLPGNGLPGGGEGRPGGGDGRP